MQQHPLSRSTSTVRLQYPNHTAEIYFKYARMPLRELCYCAKENLRCSSACCCASIDGILGMMMAIHAFTSQYGNALTDPIPRSGDSSLLIAETNLTNMETALFFKILIILWNVFQECGKVGILTSVWLCKRHGMTMSRWGTFWHKSRPVREGQ